MNLKANLAEYINRRRAGLKWGKHLAGGWPLFCWQETLKLMEPDLPPDLFSRQRDKILKIIAIHRRHRHPFPRPIPIHVRF